MSERAIQSERRSSWLCRPRPQGRDVHGKGKAREREREREIKAEHSLGGGEESEERAGRCPDLMPER